MTDRGLKIPREFGGRRLYSGPYVAASGAWWVFVANGIRPLGQVFAPSKPLRDALGSGMDLFPDDGAAIDPVVPSWSGATYHGTDPLVEDDDDGGDGETDDGEVMENDLVAEPAPATVKVRVLGPLEVTGWRAQPERAVVTELACYLALHADRSIPGDELRAAFRPNEEQETSAKTLRTYMSLLRRALGSDLVPTGAGGGYRVSPAVTTDWHRFQALTGPAADAPALREALALVRGRPFAGTATGTFGWVYAELLVSEMEVTIAGATRRLAERAAATGDLETASWAIRQGLIGVPGDVGLWRLHLVVAARQGALFLERARRDAEAALGSDAEDLLGDPPGGPSD